MTNNLQNILREVPRKDALSEAARERVVLVFDRVRGRVVPLTPGNGLLDRVLGRYPCFVVTNHLAPKAFEVGSITVPLSDFESNSSAISLVLTYEICCAAGEEIRFTEHFAPVVDRDRKAREDIYRWTVESLSRRNDPLSWLAHLGELSRDVKDRARAEFGVLLRIKFNVDNEQLQELSRPFEITVSEDFATSLVGIPAGLEARIPVRLPTFEKLIQDIDRRADIRDLMKGTAHAAIAEVLHRVSPARFYLYLHTVAPPEVDASHPYIGAAVEEVGDRETTFSAQEAREATLTLEQALQRNLRKRLRDRFGAEIDQITLKHTQTEITNLLRELCAAPQRLVVQVVSPSLPMTFDMWVKVDNVHPDPRGWRNFIARKPTMNDIAVTLQDALAKRLQEYEREHRHLRRIQPSKMCDPINAWARDRTKIEFGLAVTIYDVGRGQMLDEQEEQESIRYAVTAHGASEREEIDLDVVIKEDQRKFARDEFKRLREQLDEVRRKLANPAFVDSDDLTELDKLKTEAQSLENRIQRYGIDRYGGSTIKQKIAGLSASAEPSRNELEEHSSGRSKPERS